MHGGTGHSLALQNGENDKMKGVAGEVLLQERMVEDLNLKVEVVVCSMPAQWKGRSRGPRLELQFLKKSVEELYGVDRGLIGLGQGSIKGKKY